MTKDSIITICSLHLNKMQECIEGEKFQLRGIFNSEALLIVSIAKHFGVSHLIESGRARGHSTNLIAKFFESEEDFKITSIDYDNKSEDTKYSEKFLAKYKNLELVYGDSNTLINGKIREDCVVFIDGPKANDAIILAANLMRDTRVKAVLVHDLHKNSFHRDICETVFTDSFFSDDADFVEKFKHLDDDCWEVLSGTGEAPYQRYGEPISSYASTMGVFFNSPTPLVQPAYANYLDYLQVNSPTVKNLFIKTVPNDTLFFRIVFSAYKLLKLK